MLDQEDIQNLFENKYKDRLGLSYQQWLEEGPQTEDQAYTRLQEIDDELKDTYQTWQESNGVEKDELEEWRDRLKAEYDLIEEVFGLELNDR